MPAIDGETFQFDLFRLDVGGRRLLCDGEEVPLRPKAFDVLHHLVQHQGRVVSIDELLDVCWRDVIVSPNTVSNIIYLLRSIFVAAGKGDWIQTVARHGYRFTAPVQPAGARHQQTAETVATTVAPMGPSRRDQELPEQVDSFVGRGQELALLEQCWQQAVHGVPATIFITGEAGLGKTSIVRRFCAQAAPRPVVCVGRCLSQVREGEPYMPVLEALGSLRATSELAEIARVQAPTWLSQMPWLMPSDERSAPAALGAISGSTRMLREGKRLFAALAERGPLLLVLEDVHWADSATVELIRALAEEDRPSSLMILATYRPGEVVLREHPLRQVVPELAARANHCHVLALASLTPALVREYLQRRFASPTWAGELAPRLEERSGGNPLFLDAMTTFLCEQNRIVPSSEGWALAAAPVDLEVGLPEGLREMIRARIRRLAPDSVPVIEAASAAGMDFSTLEVAAALAVALPIAAQACEALAREGHLVRLVGEVVWPDGSGGEVYRFAHAAYCETVATDTQPSRRRLLHGRIGERMAAAYGERAREIAPRLAMHFGAAGNLECQLEFLHQSLDLAAGRYAHREMLAYLDHILELLARLPPNEERKAREVGYHVVRSRLLMDWQGGAAAHDGFVRVVELAQQQGNRFFEFFGHVGCCLSAIIGHSANTAREMESMLEIAANGHSELTALAHAVSGCVRDSVGDPTGAVSHGEAALAALPYALAGVLQDSDTEVLVRTLLQSALGRLGHLERSRQERLLTIQRAEAACGLLSKAHTYAFLACDALITREPAVALDFAQRSIANAREGDFELLLAAGEAAYEAARIAQASDDDIDPDGLQRLAAAVEKRRRSNQRWYNMLLTGYLADGYRRRGDLEQARAQIDAALVDAGTIALPELWRIKGMVELDAARSGTAAERKRGREQAARCFQSAIDLARQCQAKLFELRSMIALTRLRRGADGTHAALAAIAESFASKSASTDADEAKALLVELTRP